MAKRNGKGLIASALIAFAPLLAGLLMPDRADAADRPATASQRLEVSRGRHAESVTETETGLQSKWDRQVF